MKVSLPDEAPLQSFAKHLRATDAAAADTFIDALIRRLKVRAL